MDIGLARHGRHIAIVSIDNGPRLNAMTRQMLSKLGALWDELDRDLTCRCIILTAVGQRAFTVGADISGDLSAGPETARMVNLDRVCPARPPRRSSDPGVACSHASRTRNDGMRQQMPHNLRSRPLRPLAARLVKG